MLVFVVLYAIRRSNGDQQFDNIIMAINYLSMFSCRVGLYPIIRLKSHMNHLTCLIHMVIWTHIIMSKNRK